MTAPAAVEIKCPVCRDEMHEADERYCEECGRKVCKDCATSFDKCDKKSAIPFYHLCETCLRNLHTDGA